MRFVPYTIRKLSQCRPTGTAANVQRITILPNATVETFREAFNAGNPVQLPQQALSDLPAIRRWFTQRDGIQALNMSYLSKFGEAVVPLELSNAEQKSFTRIQHSLAFFLESTTSRQMGTTQIYLAQASIAHLPSDMRADLPVPELVTRAGKGDIYDSSIWIGQAHTYTPLHKDPNPNLFVQLAGSKVVRLFRPEIGRAIFAKAQEMAGSNNSAAIRGEEMMVGLEKDAIDSIVWNNDPLSSFGAVPLEAELHSGDALHIPKGWWHSIKSSSSGINGSVNWWFR